MNKKILAISVIAVFICLTVMPTNVGAGLIFNLLVESSERIRGKLIQPFQPVSLPLLNSQSDLIQPNKISLFLSSRIVLVA